MCGVGAGGCVFFLGGGDVAATSSSCELEGIWYTNARATPPHANQLRSS